MEIRKTRTPLLKKHELAPASTAKKMMTAMPDNEAHVFAG